MLLGEQMATSASQAPRHAELRGRLGLLAGAAVLVAGLVSINAGLVLNGSSVTLARLWGDVTGADAPAAVAAPPVAADGNQRILIEAHDTAYSPSPARPPSPCSSARRNPRSSKRCAPPGAPAARHRTPENVPGEKEKVMEYLAYLLGPLGCALAMAVLMALMARGLRRPHNVVDGAEAKEVADFRAEIAALRGKPSGAANA